MGPFFVTWPEVPVRYSVSLLVNELSPMLDRTAALLRHRRLHLTSLDVTPSTVPGEFQVEISVESAAPTSEDELRQWLAPAERRSRTLPPSRVGRRAEPAVAIPYQWQADGAGHHDVA